MTTIEYDNIGKALIKHDLVPAISKVFIGIEAEKHRVDQTTGLLSQLSFPNQLKNSQGRRYLGNDFAASQVEEVTPRTTDLQSSFQYLEAINKTFLSIIDHKEILWNYSMPPAISDEFTEFDISRLDDDKSITYFQKIANKMGFPRWELLSGVHINVGLNNEVLQKLHEVSFHERFSNQIDFVNDVYTKIARGLYRYRWIITLLFGASPFAFKNYFDSQLPTPKQPMRSIRSAQKYGFESVGTNSTDDVSYQSVAEYVSDIKRLVGEGKLLAAKNFHGGVRFRGQDTYNLAEQGVDYLELRIFDLNPLSTSSVNLEQLEFIRLLILYLTMTPENESSLHDAGIQHEIIAIENPLEASSATKIGLDLLSDLKDFAQDSHLNHQFLISLRNQIIHPEQSIAGQLATIAGKEDLKAWLFKKFHDDVSSLVMENPEIVQMIINGLDLPDRID